MRSDVYVSLANGQLVKLHAPHGCAVLFRGDVLHAGGAYPDGHTRAHWYPTPARSAHSQTAAAATATAAAAAAAADDATAADDGAAHDRSAHEAALAAAHHIWTPACEQTLRAALRSSARRLRKRIAPAAACLTTSGSSTSPAPSRPPSRPRRAGRPRATP
jgi:hypothetical protein